jgi:DNA topoisomerase I
MNLVIVESPAKAKTIEGYLGKDYKVLASYGHIRDLPKSKLGIDTETLEPEYIIPVKSRKQVTALKKEVAQVSKIILATDEDREGEAIAWHILKALDVENLKTGKNKPVSYERIVFHEITKEAILAAAQKPRKLNKHLVDAQQARRVLDRLVGYNLSPLLWKKIRRGLSAGRVQSVALRLIVEREREIEAFNKEEYWEIFALITPELNQNSEDKFQIKLIKKEDKKIEIKSKKEAEEIADYLKKQELIVSDVVKSEKKRQPYAPFTTSTLQQEAAQKLRFSAKKTMMIAQKLYEGVKIPQEGSVGLITYMRTDSTNLSNQILEETRSYIKKEYGDKYLPAKPNLYKSKKGAQEAHEAIRPTAIKRHPEEIKDSLDEDQLKLYRLIWKRTLASQMNPEILDLVRIDVKAGHFILRANGKQIKFDGFSKVYLEGTKGEQAKANKEVILPEIKIEEKCNLIELDPQQKFTQPPARYTEASLVKTLEENGIGRPSTYAPTISTLKDRRYIISEKRLLMPQEIGFIVNDMLVEHFPEVVDLKFTAEIETELDEIAAGNLEWKKPIQDFWVPFSKKIESKESQIEKINTDIATDLKCEKCGKEMVIKEGRFGKFYACSGFPDCKNAKPYLEKTGQSCPECEKGDIIIKRTKGGRTFWGCSRYPECKWASWTPPESKE